MKYLNYLFFSLCIIVAALYFIGVLFFLADHEPLDKCEMTYMFEYPQYVRVSQKIDGKYPKYGLYVYGEGRTTKKARNMYFDGIPVLFIPGNAGSYQQVRSLSSVALRKALNSGTPYHFDYFTVDLNAEFSALYGPVLYEQLEYVLSSISRILELYKSSPCPPEKVVLIGHSVVSFNIAKGGIIAKKVTTEQSRHKKNLVASLITLASPMRRAPLYFDRQVSTFYKTALLDEGNVTTISIAGGYSDFLVPSYLSEIEGNGTLNLIGTNIPKAWVESNHVQILWCKQIVLAINRALFDSVDQKSRQISTDAYFVKKVFEHHLIFNSGTRHHLKPYSQKLTKIDYKGEWIESLYKQYSVEHKKGIREPHWYMIGFTNLPTYEMLTVLALNLEVTEWVFVCNAAFPNKGRRVCIEAEHLTQYSEIVPTIRYKRRLITINMHELRKNHTDYTHVVFRALPTSEPVTFYVDIYGSYERKTDVLLPVFSLKKQIIVSQTPEKALLYDLILPELENILQVYKLFVEPINCSSKQHHATASLIVPWANENIHLHFTEALRKPFLIRLQNPKPHNANNAKVRLTLEPTCTYRVSVQLHIFGFFAQIARYYSPYLITYIAVVFLLGFQRQISQMGESGTVPIFLIALVDGLKQSWVIPAAFLFSKVRYPLLMKVLPQTEFLLFENDDMISPLVLFMVSFVIVLILAAIYCVSLFTLESTVHKLSLKLLARTITLTIRFSDYFMKFLQKMPFLVAAVLISLCFSTCGGLALCVGMIFYFLKLTQMSQDYIEQVVWIILKSLAKKCKKVFSKNNTRNGQTLVIVKKTLDGNTDNKDDNGKQESFVDEQINRNDSKECPNITESNNLTDEKDKENDENKKISLVTDICKDGELEDEEEEGTKQPENTQSNSRIEPKGGSSNEDGLINNLSANNAICFHSSIFFMWVIITILNIPAVLTWAHNFKYSKNLVPDESFLPGLVLSLGALPLWQFELPRTNRKFTRQLRIIIITFIMVSLLYATVSVYRLNYMLTILFALVLLQQCYAPKMVTENENSFDDKENKQKENKYEEVKMKID